MIVQRLYTRTPSRSMAGSLASSMGGSRSWSPLAWWADIDGLSRQAAALAAETAEPAQVDARFAALNIGTTPTSVEVYAFAPGVDPATLDVQVDQGMLTLQGERTTAPAAAESKDIRVHGKERFEGRFVRRVALPDDADASRIDATYRDGVLRVSIARRQPAQARRVVVS